MDELLKTLQEKRMQLGGLIKAHADRQASWTAEDRQKWATLNAEYDANMKALTERRQVVEQEAAEREALNRRLTEIAGYQDYRPVAAGAHRLIGRDGASLAGGVRNAAFFQQTPERRREFDRLQALALQAWMLAGRAENHHLITDEQADAARALNIHLGPGAGEVELRLGDTRAFRNAQGFYRGGTRSRGGDSLTFLNGTDFMNAMQEGRGSAGGFLVGETLLNRLEMAMLNYSGILQVAEVLRTTTGEPLNWPTMDDTGNTGSRVGEGEDAGIGTSTQPTGGRLQLQAFIFTSKFINVSRALMTDASISFEDLIGTLLGTRIGRKQNTDFTTGADAGNGPMGLVTSATLGVTGASTTALAFDELIDLEHSIDPARRRNAGVGFMWHDSILKVIRKLKNGMGDYLWSQGTTAAAPDLVNNRPYWINQAMASAIVSGAKTVLFGELPMYKVRQVNSIVIERLRERRAEYYEDVFIAYERADGGLLDPGDHPVKYLTH